jgi:hypothetical protein
LGSPDREFRLPLKARAEGVEVLELLERRPPFGEMKQAPCGTIRLRSRNQARVRGGAERSLLNA